MDEIVHQKHQSVNKFSKPHFLKKALQLLLSVSVFSFLFSYSSWLPLFLHPFNLYYSAFPLYFFNNTIDRKYMFLICNGILVFLARNSGFIGSSLFGVDLQDEFSNQNTGQREFLEMNYVIEEKVEVQSVGSFENVVVEEDKQVGQDQEEEEEEEEEGNGLLSTEELNKKFDDFIKKMKEEIMIEAQEEQRLVMV